MVAQGPIHATNYRNTPALKTETQRVGRLINHSSKSPNVKPEVVLIDETPGIIFMASKTITMGAELLYDYKDRRRTIVNQYPWLKD